MKEAVEIMPYQGTRTHRFGATIESMIAEHGPPASQLVNRDGETELHYDGFIARFDAESLTLREMTFAHGYPLRYKGATVDWTSAGMEKLCLLDEDPKMLSGTVILLSLGITLTGMGDEEESERSMSIFQRGDWDDFRPLMTNFKFSR